MADDDLDILAWTMLGEAGGEGPQGMSDVAHVVLNRLNAGNYGSSIQDVALAPKQFSTWNSGSGGNDPKGKYPKDSPEFQRARQLAEQVIGGQIPGPPGRPLDYNADDITPYWASSKDNNGTYTRNGHTFYPSVPIPPGELPEVGTLQDTRRTPSPVTPVTATPDMSLMRSNAAPSQLIPDTFARLPKSSSANLGDNLALSPVQGGAQQAPLFDAAFDTRLGAMRTLTSPIDSQGIAYGASKAPPPVPASVEDRVTARNRSLPPIVRLPELPPSTIGQSPSTRVAQSVPVPSRPSIPQSYAGQERSGPTIPPSQPLPSSQQIMAATGFRGGGPIAVPDRLTPEIMAGAKAPPPTSIPGATWWGASVGESVNPQGQRVAVADAYFPYPMPRPNFMPQVGTQLAVTPPMPPMPIPRPGIGGPFRVAPVPAPRSQRPGLFRIGGFELPQLPTQARTVAGRTSMIDTPLRQVFNGSGRPNTAAVQSHRNEGMSPAQAYDAANQAAAQRARDRSGNSTERSDYFRMATGG